MEKKTPCECPLAGLCNRHNMNKTPHYHKLCQNHKGYFDQWENCKGPGQNQMDCIQNKRENKIEPEPAKERPKKELELPSAAQQATNFAGSFLRHALSGFGKADEQTFNDRLNTCVDCEFYMPDIARCSKCGCPCTTKASWKSSRCPVGKW